MQTPSFKDIIQNDVKAVFLNPDEFAERCTIEYNGVVCKNIIASIQDISESDRAHRSADDYGQGLYRASAVLYCTAEDLGGGILRKGHTLVLERRVGNQLIRRKYTVVSCACEMGMVEAELGEVTVR